MANNPKQQCTTVAPPNRRILVHAPLVLLLVASGSCFAAESDADAVGASGTAGTQGASETMPADVPTAGATSHDATAPDTTAPDATTPHATPPSAQPPTAQPPTAPTAIAQVSGTAMPTAPSPTPAGAAP
ncbi:poly-beta-1,6 N-acetyl-D-glucosamine export porin PgaA, partial [Burkholderia multivorans]